MTPERDHVLAALRSADSPLSPAAIQGAAGLASRNATDLLLGKMVKAGQIVRAGRGLYCVAGQTEEPAADLSDELDLSADVFDLSAKAEQTESAAVPAEPIPVLTIPASVRRALTSPGQTYEEANWARLSPVFRTAHNRLRVLKGFAPIPAPKIDLYVPKRGPTAKPFDFTNPEFVASAKQFMGPVLMGGRPGDEGGSGPDLSRFTQRRRRPIEGIERQSAPPHEGGRGPDMR
jgi:hypothetical protein